MNPRDEITSGEDLINLDDVRERIKVLHPFHVEDTRLSVNAAHAAFAEQHEAEDWISRQPADLEPYLEVIEWSEELEELNALRQLEEAMVQHGEHTSAIAEHYMKTFVQNDREGLYGPDAVTALGNYIDWGAVAKDRTAQEVRFRGGVYFLVPLPPLLGTAHDARFPRGRRGVRLRPDRARYPENGSHENHRTHLRC